VNITIFVCGALLLAGCLSDSGSPGDSVPDDGPPLVDTDGWMPARPVLPEGWPTLQWPEDNPYSHAKAILGRHLFFEATLSADQSISCGSCHKVGSAFADAQRQFSTGIQGRQTGRNSPTVANMIFSPSFMHDGRHPTLEAQALGPLMSPDEMGMTPAAIESVLAADPFYVGLFAQAYGPGPVTLGGVAKALATYQRLLVSYQSPYDRWAAGDTAALSPAARRGAQVFLGTKGGCVQCHVPPLFTDGGFHNTGLRENTVDSGRARVTGSPADLARFKTPTLRNVAVTWPYMHDGTVQTLAEVVAHYNSGGRAHPNADALMRPLELTTQESADLVAFLEALSDSVYLANYRP
jgi:cytochrome c peroxidase